MGMPDSKQIPWGKWSLLLLSVFFCFLLLTAPARLLPQLVNKVSPNVQLQHATGSLWDGSVATAVVIVEGGAINLGKLSWRINPFSLLWLSPSLHIDTDAGSHSLSADLSVSLLGQEIEAEAVSGQFPISLLEPWVPMLVRGEVELAIDRLVVDQKSLLDAIGKIYVQDLDWMMGAKALPVGSYTAELSVVDGSLLIKVSDRQAQLGVDGLLTANPDGSYQVEAWLSATEGLAPEIKQGLRFLGKKNEAGDILFNDKGRWR
jgi:general secretion pathway protein N